MIDIENNNYSSWLYNGVEYYLPVNTCSHKGAEQVNLVYTACCRRQTLSISTWIQTTICCANYQPIIFNNRYMQSNIISIQHWVNLYMHITMTSLQVMAILTTNNSVFNNLFRLITNTNTTPEIQIVGHLWGERQLPSGFSHQRPMTCVSISSSRHELLKPISTFRPEVGFLNITWASWRLK